jgi:signal transduction histidine kinase/CheY-like chemotaxis protein
MDQDSPIAARSSAKARNGTASARSGTTSARNGTASARNGSSPARKAAAKARNGRAKPAAGNGHAKSASELNQHELLNALHAMQAGDFSVRLPGHQVGVAGKICDAFNTIIAANRRIAQQLEHVGEVVGHQGKTRTAREERTAELRKFNEELELRIEERTRERELALAQLFEAQKMDTIGRLTGGVAHDFNNLLMAVLGSLTLLEKRLPDDLQIRRLLQNAIQGANRGKALTQRLLAFSRRQELKPQAVDLAQLLLGMEDLLKRAVGHGIAFSNDFPNDLPPVMVDANQLELALLNLALNARDAMQDGGNIKITARADTVGSPVTSNWRRIAKGLGKSFSDTVDGPALMPGDYVRITIVDTGVGMDEATLAKATEPFFTTKGPGKGTGLGLSMVHGLAAQSGGLLRIRSEPNAGTVVDLWLPRAKCAPAILARSAESPSSPDTTPCRVLIVDDDTLVITGIAAMVLDLGHTPVEAHSGAEALDLLGSGLKVDVVFTDHAMPVMNGLQLAGRIQERFPGLPIILATGYAELPVDPATLGIARLAKPCTQHEIAAAIHAAVVASAASDRVAL